jgi:hypothetical protein
VKMLNMKSRKYEYAALFGRLVKGVSLLPKAIVILLSAPLALSKFPRIIRMSHN